MTTTPMRVSAALVSMLTILLVSTATAAADSTRPGMISAAQAVYGNTDQGDVLGQVPNTPGTSTEPGGQGAPPGVQGDEPASRVTPVAVEDGASDGNGVTSIPFTGYAALTMIGIGIALVLGGAALRLAGRRTLAA